MTASDLLADLRRRGVTLAAAGDRLRWCPREALSGEEQEALARHKPELLAILAARAEPLPPAQPSTPSAAPWDQAEADALVNAVLARRRQAFGETDWPSGPAAYRRLQPLAGAVDDSWWAQDMEGLRLAVGEFLAADVWTMPERSGMDADETPRPPPGALLYFQDEHGRPCGHSDKGKDGKPLVCRWTWSGCKRWYDAKQDPPPCAPHHGSRSRPGAGGTGRTASTHEE
jgi:hypothetical protein